MEKRKLLTIPIAFLAIAVIGMIVYFGLHREEDTVDVENVSVSNETEQIVETDNRTFTTDKKDIEALQSENPDIYAWISIPGTSVDFPILQSEEDNYYLNRKVDGSEGYPGSIYTNAIDGKNFERPNTVVYGHNMKDGSYFGQLHLFENQDFFNENNEVNVYLSDRKLTYKIIISSHFSDEYLPDKYDFSLPIGCKQFLNDVVAFAPEDESTSSADSIDMGEWEQIITLSTCVAGVSEERYLVIAALEKVELYE